MTGVYIHISSNDSKKLYAGNRLDDFVVEFDAEISPCHSSGNMRAGGGGGGELAVAVTELSIVGAKPFANRHQTLAESCVLLCDICDSSYICGVTSPVLRVFPSANELSVSLFQPYYVAVRVRSFKRIHFQVKTRDLLPLDSDKWDLTSVVRCTLHFVNL